MMTRPLSESRFTGFQRIATILGMSLVLAAAINAVHPRQIPWVQDWNNYVESKAAAAGIEVLPLGQALAMHDKGNCLFVDARELAEYGMGHVAGAVSLPAQSWDLHVDTLDALLDADYPLVVYCRNRECDDALMLAIELKAMGKSDLYYYVDGFELWEEMECPIVSQ